MPVRIRSARAGDREEIPDLWQGCPLRRGAALAGRAGGAAVAAGGVAAMVAGAGGPVELLGAGAAALGAVAVAASVRCRRFEVSVGRDWVRIELGPFRRTVARGLLARPAVVDASGWRRWYATREVAVEVAASGEVLRLPSRDPEELARSLGVAGPAPGADLERGR